MNYEFKFDIGTEVTTYNGTSGRVIGLSIDRHKSKWVLIAYKDSNNTIQENYFSEDELNSYEV